VEAGDGGREEHFIKKEKFKTFTMSWQYLIKPTDSAININTTG
jgi:hypothetical protein